MGKNFEWSLGEKAYFTVEELWNKAMEDNVEDVMEALETAGSIKDAIEEGWFDAKAVDKEYDSFSEEIECIYKEAEKRLEELDSETAKLKEAVKDMTDEEAEDFLIGKLDAGSEVAGAVLAEIRAKKEGYREEAGVRCPKCGAPLYQETHVPGYEYVCLVCEENFCEFEVF